MKIPKGVVGILGAAMSAGMFVGGITLAGAPINESLAFVLILGSLVGAGLTFVFLA